MQLSLPDPTLPARKALGQLATILLSYVLTLVALSTLSPFNFTVPSQLEINFSVGLHDVVLNLLLLLPAGFLFSLMRDPPRLDQHSLLPHPIPRPRDALLAGAALSLSLESLQLLSPNRFSSPIDLITNALGAYLGALLFQRLRPFVARGLAHELTLRMPLSHLFYLLTVLLLIDGLMGLGAEGRRLLTVPLCAAGAIICAAIYNHRLREQTRIRRSQVALFAFCWCALGAMPAWLKAPVLGFCVASASALLCYGLCWLGYPSSRGRRFELPTLQAVAVPITGYLAGLFLYSQEPRGSQHDQRIVFDAIETLGALTLVGYGVAEAMGRRISSSRKALAWTAALVLPASLLMEWAAAALAGHPPRIWMGPAVLLFSAWGAAIYRAELRLVKALTQATSTAH